MEKPDRNILGDVAEATSELALFDTHAHLADDQLAADLSAVLDRAQRAAVRHILAVGTSLASSRACLAIARQYPNIFAAAGIHPNHAAEAAPSDWDDVVRLAAEDRVVALGETGLDLYWKDVPLAVQQDFFDRHIRLSQQVGLPLVIHLRETAGEILAMLVEARRRGPLRGVMHSFTGTADQAREFLDLGLNISFAGMVTYKKSTDLREVARSVPLDRLLVETDCPYLSPEPVRGERPNQTSNVTYTAACLAEVRSLTLAELAQHTTANAMVLFRRAG
jgi:TatD DNase family protein